MKKLLSSLIACSLILNATAQAPQLFGMAENGGSFNQGTIFKMNPNGSGVTVVHNFSSPAGWKPQGNLLQASDGNLYGTCYEGGIYASCTIFRFNPSTNTYADVWDFDITNGDFPESGVIEGPGGILYGVTPHGGTSYSGVIYSYNIASDIYTALYSFNNTLGNSPFGSPILVGNKLYGLTTSGGAKGVGVLYSYDLTSSTYSNLHDFESAQGANPYGSLFKASDGKLYGMTRSAGANAGGTIFSYDMNTSTFTHLYDFNSSTGSNPYGSLVQSSSGMMYGLASTGGINNGGVIFSFNPTNNSYAKLDLDNTSGTSPIGDLMLDANGNLYGTTSQGGTYSYGTAFSFDPTGNIFTKLLDFDGVIGSNPNGTFIPVSATATGITDMEFDKDMKLFPNPTTGEFTVHNLHFTIGYELKITNTLGETILQKTINRKQETVTLSAASGIYFLHVKTPDGVAVKKIIKE